jgi:hypothetical protein
MTAAFFPYDSGLKKRHFESQEDKLDSLLTKGGNGVKVNGVKIADVKFSDVKENVVKADNMRVVVKADDGKADVKADNVSLRNHPCRLDLDVQKLCYNKDGQVKKSPEVLKPQCDIGELAKDCELLKKLHGYNKTVDKEETEFPLAFGECVFISYRKLLYFDLLFHNPPPPPPPHLATFGECMICYALLPSIISPQKI